MLTVINATIKSAFTFNKPIKV